MGQRGPKPKPAALKFVAGNPGKRPVQTGRARMRRAVPDRPPELTGEAAAEWDRRVPDLGAVGTLAAVDRGILAAYCLAVADMLAARDAINCDGRFIRVPIQNSRGESLGSKLSEHPACKMLDRASARVQKLGAELGLTPAARDRVEGAGPSEAPKANAVVALRDRIQAARSGG